MKHGQFTLLVVMGVIAVVAILTVIYMRIQSTSQQEVREKVETYLATNNVEKYVKSCLASVAKTGIATGLKQGGVLWKDQGGPTKRSDYTQGIDWDDVQGMKKTYVIKTLDEHLKCGASDFNTTPPAYPRQSLNGNQLHLSDYTYFKARKLCVDPHVGFAGTASIPNLCKYNVTRTSMSRCNGPYTGRQPTGIHSFQTSLANYTETNLPKCTNFTTTSSDVTVHKQPRVNYTFTNDAVKVTAVYPVTVSIDGETTTTTTTVTNTINADVKQFYEFIHNVLIREANFPRFTLEEETSYSNSPSYKTTYSITVQDTALSADLFTATVTGVNVKGEQLQFQGLINNRRPILNHIMTPTTGVPLDNMHPDGNTANCDTSQQLANNLRAIDPDEDALTWREQWEQGPTKTGKENVLTVTASELDQSNTDTVNISVKDQHGTTDYQLITTNPNCTP